MANAQKKSASNLRTTPCTVVRAHLWQILQIKFEGTAQGEQLIYKQMLKVDGRTQTTFRTGFLPILFQQKDGLNTPTQLAEKGIQIRVLTNSFLANDVPLVHAFYQQYRVDLLKSGIRLYEFKPYIERKKRTWYEVATGNVIPAKGKNTSSLHAKFFDIDGMVFVGSFNLDPRSANLNTEVGLVLESEQLQNDISQSLDRYLPQIAYELQLDENGQIIWLDHQADGSIQTYHHDPETTQFQRFMMKTVSLFPIEWMM